jgi:hypothetical protein
VADALLAHLDSLLAEAPAFQRSNLFVGCEHGDAAVARFSQWCTHRIIWGGDESVKAARSVPLPSWASERVFGSKRSHAVFCAPSYEGLGEAEREALIGAFVADAYPFQQRACSSPRTVVWVTEDPELYRRCVADFAARAEAWAARRGWGPAPGDAVDRMVGAFAAAAGDDACTVEFGRRAFVSVIFVERPSSLPRHDCGGGFLGHVQAAQAGQVGELLDDADQTITHFGFTPEDVEALARTAGARGVDRVVPVGEALAFEATWDGFDLLSDVLRRVVVRTCGGSMTASPAAARDAGEEGV